MSNPHAPIGFIGQGWIGKHYADDFVARGYEVVRYALEEPYAHNKQSISECNIVFIAVPTPTTQSGFDDSAVRAVLPLIKHGGTAVIKSTLLPGTTKALQADFPDIAIFHSPEFLTEKTAAHDAAHPNRNLIGIPADTTENRQRAARILNTLPSAPYTQIMDSTDAEMVKYAGNCFLFTKVLFMNLLYDLVAANEGDFERVREAMSNDPRIGESHTKPIHVSGHDETAGGVQKRGAGGHCFIKDFEAFRSLYRDTVGDARGAAILSALTEKNLELLVSTEKDFDLVAGVFGDTTLNSYKPSSRDNIVV